MKTDIKTLKKNFERILEKIGNKLEGDSPAKNHEWQLYITHLRNTNNITEQKFEKIKFEFWPKGTPKPKEFSELSDKEQQQLLEIRKQFTEERK